MPLGLNSGATVTKRKGVQYEVLTAAADNGSSFYLVRKAYVETQPTIPQLLPNPIFQV